MISKHKLFIVGGGEDSRAYLFGVLKNEYQIFCSDNTEEALALLGQMSPDAVLVDVRHPEKVGPEFCEALRNRLCRGDVAVLVVSSLNEPDLRMRSFRAGADDFISTPFLPEEIQVRLAARLRRLRRQERVGGLIVAGRMHLDVDRLEARIGMDRMALGPVEFKILSLLARGLGQLRSREDIVDFVWSDRRPASRALDPHINSLRRKLMGSDLELRTVYGVGYSLCLKDA